MPRPPQVPPAPPLDNSLARSRRGVELGLVLLAGFITAGAYVLASLGQRSPMPARIVPFMLFVLSLLGAAHVAVRYVARGADPLILPTAALLHGMGFAGVLLEIGLPAGERLNALIAFNVGVELGQLTVITVAFLSVSLWFRNRHWYRSRIVVPCSLLISLVGAYWTNERVIG